MRALTLNEVDDVNGGLAVVIGSIVGAYIGGYLIGRHHRNQQEAAAAAAKARAVQDAQKYDMMDDFCS